VTPGCNIVVDALAARTGGTAYAAVEVARALARDPGAGEVTVVTRRGSIVATELRAGERPRDLQLLELGTGGRSELVGRLLWEARTLPRMLRQRRAGLLTWSGMLPRRVDSKVVSILANPVMFEKRRQSDRLRRWAVRRTTRNTDHVLVPTAAMVPPVEQLTGVRPEVVAWGINHERFTPAEAPGDEVVCVADFYEHKRHELLLQAWAALEAPRPVLRLVGDPRVNPTRVAEFEARIEAMSALGVVVIESIPQERMPQVYRRARTFVLASELETFCMPLLEAQACGVPALVRDLPVLRETGGPGTTYVDSDSVARWTEALSRLLSDDAAHRSAREAGLRHASQYSWERAAAAIAERLA
jgi:glycosyltransferase involved in cell wall biosynthesis